MGAAVGAEVCEVVGIFLLNEIREHLTKLKCGLYRGDGLANHGRIGGREMESIRQRLSNIFNQHGLRITIEPSNKSIVNFVEVTMSLETGTYAPIRKSNDTPVYLHKSSNQPPASSNKSRNQKQTSVKCLQLQGTV